MDNITYLPLTRQNTTSVATNSASQTAASSSEARLKKACSDFESIFISMIMRQMLDSIPRSSESVTGSDLMNTLADQAVAQHIAANGGFGLADVMYKQLSKSLLDSGTEV